VLEVNLGLLDKYPTPELHPSRLILSSLLISLMTSLLLSPHLLIIRLK
jgi:hypothetical protein